MNNQVIAIVGLGYVGLPLAVAFSKKGFDVIGFDINTERIQELQQHTDNTLEVSQQELQEASSILYTDAIDELKKATIYIVTVPTPITNQKLPNLNPLRSASESVGSVLKKGDIVIYESTVFPGCTEEFCAPILEKVSKLTYNEDFYCGYSPERINPGDKKHRIDTIVKVTSGSTPEIATVVDALYGQIITAGTFKVSSIKVAEAAKVIENSQRDINIAFVNELALIFGKLDIDTHEVLEAAGTKWNFLPFTPGLVGGHCIGVDPYYLAQKAQEIGHHPEIILAGRRINDSMSEYVATEVLKLMVQKEIAIKDAKILMLGITFKENCPDIRNTKAVDLYQFFKSFHMNVDIYDPWASVEELQKEYGIDIKNELEANVTYDVIVNVVAHKEFLDLDLATLKKNKSIVYDVKGNLDRNSVDKRL
ncbi:MAG: nucleotide sugar dehydrogenase [Bacteroidota bacterium]